MSLYFRNIPNLEYISRDDRSISEYTKTKNLFTRGKIREDIFGDLTYFTRYEIIGDERPDNIALKVYNDETLDWVVMLSNNILNLYDEWPLTQESFDSYLIEKYGSYSMLNATHHYETKEIRDSLGKLILKSGLIVPKNFILEYYDPGKLQISSISGFNVYNKISNYEYEERLENNKRNIFLLKENYLSLILDDVETKLKYKKGSTQYIGPTLKRVDNIRLYND
jgi:hypothetical protein